MEMKPIKIDELMSLTKEDLDKINFNCTEIADENLSKKDSNGFPAVKGKNSDGEFGNEKTPKVFFSQGIDETLKLANRALRLIMYTLENRMNEKGQKGMKVLGIEEYYKEEIKTFENITLDELDIDNIKPEIRDKFFSIAQKKLKDMTYYIFDLNGCSRDEYEKLNDVDKEKIDYLTDDYDEDSHTSSHKQMPKYNMHTMSYKGIDVDKVHRIVRDDGSKINAFDILMKICQRYKQLNPNKSFPYIINEDGSGENWLESFYEQYLIEMKNHTKILNKTNIVSTAKEEGTLLETENAIEDLTELEIEKEKIGDKEKD